jgi:hypothetical protein
MTAAWGGRAPATWNRRVATVRSFLTFCQRRRWLAEDLTVDLERRPELLLYETAARANEDDGGHKRGSTSRNRSRLPRKIQC